MSSYPILFLLIIGIAAAIYIGGQYKPLEVTHMLKLEAKMQLKQKRQSMQKEFDDIEMIDLEGKSIFGAIDQKVTSI